MNKSATLMFAFVAASLSVSAQYRTPKVQDSDWVAHPAIHMFPKEYAQEPALVLTQSNKIDYKYEGKGASVYYTFHRTVKLLDQRGIEMYSTVGIPFYTAAKIEELKARTISAEGKVYDIPRHMFKLSQDENGAPEIKFAMEGVGKNAEVEVYVKALIPFNCFGTQYFQCPIPILDLSFEMSYPKEFILEQRGFNLFPTLKDTLITGRRHMKTRLKDIPGIKPEPYSFLQPHIMRTEWRLSYWADDNGNEKRLFTWDEFAKEFYENVFNIPDGRTPEKYFLTPNGQDVYRGDTERKAVNNFLNRIGVTGSETELEKIIKIEKGIKTTIGLYPATEDHSGKLDTIIARKSATHFGYLKLFAACFAQTDVKCEIGSTTNRKYHLFNSTFENWNDLDDYVFYFPNQKAYLAPTNVLLRYPMISEGALGNEGAFCKMSTPSEPRPRVADVRNIPTTSCMDNYSNLNATVNFGKGMEPEIDLNYSFGGYEAVPFRNNFAVAPNPDKQRQYLENYIPVVNKPSYLIKYTAANIDLENYVDNKPFIVLAKVKAPEIVESAGGRKLVKIGELLGRQNELYQDKVRKLPVDISYPHSYKRTITVNLPAGYRVLNAKSLKNKIDFYDADNRKIPACSFVSNYSQKGNKLTITVSEIYAQIHYHLSDFNNFRKVINAAADFNKTTLVLGR